MLRFVAVSIATCLLMACTVGLSVILGRHQSPSPALQRFQLDDCASPCIMSATLGKTHYDNALSLFKSWHNTLPSVMIDNASPDTVVLRMMDPDGKTVANEITVGFADGIVDSVMVQGVYGSGHGTIPTLGDLVSTYGSPLCAQSDPPAGSSFGNITILNPQLGIKVMISGWYDMSWYTPVGAFSVLRYVPGSELTDCTCQRQWRGAQPVSPPTDEGCTS